MTKSKCCLNCGSDFPKDPRLSFKQWEAVKYCARKCMAEHRRFTAKQWEESFLAKRVERSPEECWEWTGARCEKSYGMTRTNDGRGIRAPRVAYELHYGVSPGDLLVCHKCDNPPCVNPHHLFLGTAKDNNDDKIAKGRMVVTRGDDRYNAKIGWAGARLVKRVSIPATELAPILGVSETAIRNIRQGKTWKHIAP